MVGIFSGYCAILTRKPDGGTPLRWGKPAPLPGHSPPTSIAATASRSWTAWPGYKFGSCGTQGKLGNFSFDWVFENLINI